MRFIQPVVSSFEQICSYSAFFTSVYCTPYIPIVKNEIHLATITEADTILNIGCGAVPFSAIHLATLANAKVHGVDLDAEVVTKASRCIRRLQLGDRVTVENANGTTCSAREYSVILVALQAEPKKEILEQLINTARPKTRLLFRKPSPKFMKHYDPLPYSPQPLQSIGQPMKTFNETVMYVV